MKNRILISFIGIIVGFISISCSMAEHKSSVNSMDSVLNAVKQIQKQSTPLGNHDECSLLVGAIYGEQREFMEWERDKRSPEYRREHIELGMHYSKEDMESNNLSVVFPLLKDIAWHPYSRNAIDAIKAYCGVNFEKEKQAELKIHARLGETFVPDWIGH